MQDAFKSRNRWRAILSIIMVSAGCAAFVMSCVAAMVLTAKE